MGQYLNQPDFATRVDVLVGEAPFENIKSAAVYIGDLIDNDTTASISVIPVGNEDAVEFTGITAGTFLPVIVKQIKDYNNIAKENILLIY